MFNKKLIDIDLKKYSVYKFLPTKEFVAVLLKDTPRMNQLFSKYKGYENVPENETIMVLFLFFDKTKNTYSIKENKFVERRVNELEVTWIETKN
tara:strand:- start:635 stop:916 length:282 start_codon:yes stop_codon:yes gene_type:complete